MDRLTRRLAALGRKTSYSTQPRQPPPNIHPSKPEQSKLARSVEKLTSSFQEPLVGLSPPLVENASPTSKPSQPPPIPSTQNNPPTSLTTRPIITNEFKILPHHPFHTHRFITKLKSSKFSAQSATEILHHVENCLRSSERRWLLTGPNGGIVSKSYVEGQAYLYNAALSELRTEVQVKARNDSIVLKSTSNSIQREIDNLNQKLKEDINNLQNSLQLEFNSRKEESSDDQKKIELAIQELNSKFTISVSDVRTEIETRKWVTTRRCVVAIASLALCVIIFTALENQSPTSTNNKSSSNASDSASRSSSRMTKTSSSFEDHPKRSGSSSSSSSGLDRLGHQYHTDAGPSSSTNMRSVEELGIHADLDNFDSD